MEITVINDGQHLRFETTNEDETAYLEYRFYKKNIALMHTFVPEHLRGKGIAATLAKFAFKYADENKLQVMIYCPFVAKYITQHPEYNYLIDKIYRK